MNLFMDTTNGRLIYLLEKDNKIVAQLIRHDLRKISDYALSDLKTLLEENNVTLNQIENLYLINGPGSYLGIRVGLTMATTLKVLNPKLGVWFMNSLFYQAGLNKTISIIDARGDKLYIAVYNQGRQEVKPKIIFKSNYEEWAIPWLNQGYIVVKDYQDLNYVKNYLELKSHFQLVNQNQPLKPLYIKNFL